MDKSLAKGLVIGAIAATAVSAIAGYAVMERGPTYARVLSVTPDTKTIRIPDKDCWNESVTHRAPTKDPDQVAGTVLGAVAGGVLGNQIGGGSGKAVATVAGAAAGGYAGNKIQERMQEGNTYQTNERRCRTTYRSESRPNGYQVRYRLGDEVGTVHMDRDPGERIPVKDGKLVLEEPNRSS